MPTLAEIGALLNVAVRGDARQNIGGVATLEEAGPNDLSFLADERFLGKFTATRAAAVIVDARIQVPPNAKPAIIAVENTDLAVARVLELFAPPVPRPAAGIDADAHVAPDATLEPGVAIGPMAVIGRRVRIGAGTVIHPGVVVGDDVAIGSNCEIFPNVVIRERVQIGNRVIIHAGSVLGSDGFGYRWDGQKHAKIPQIGNVAIEDDVEIGSCVCIDRAKTGVTRIGRGTKIDNLVQIAHNCVVGAHCIIVGQVGLAGSVVLGSGVVLGGQSAVRDHISMGDGAAAAACSAVAQDVPPKQIVSGTPALPHRRSLREQAALRRLPTLIDRVRDLEEQIKSLKGTGKP